MADRNLTLQKPLRIWPGVVFAILGWILLLGAPQIRPEWGIYGMLGAIICSLGILLWWLFFSRAAWIERIGAVVLMVLAVIATKPLVHESIAGGAMGMLLYILIIPVITLALVVWAVATRQLSVRMRRGTMVLAIVVACGIFLLIRIDVRHRRAVLHRRQKGGTHRRRQRSAESLRTGADQQLRLSV